MPVYKIGDTVVHWIFGSGKVVAVADKGLPGQPCLYYVIEGNEQTLWVPVDELGNSSLHLLTPRFDFKLLTNILRSQGEEMSNNPFQRYEELDERMEKASLKDLCLVIRDLTYRSHSRKLGSSDLRVLNHAQSFLLDEWERSIGIPREKARREMEWISKEAPVPVQNIAPEENRLNN
jgi:RNA polymerase-interacting CarD/CdnL/TRCF family regulator